MIIELRTIEGSPNQSRTKLCSPNTSRKLFIGPVGAYMYCHRYAVATGATTAGAKKSVRRRFRDLTLEKSPSANRRPTRFWKIVTPMAIIKV
jgi:hypothetical protein